MNDAIEEGDIVRLRSGGPPMSVQTVTPDGIECMWFDSDGRLQEKIFHPGTLQKNSDHDGVSGS